MKKKMLIGLIIIFILFLVSVFIPVKDEKRWVNDDDIADVGHYEQCYYNIYGGNITRFVILLKMD